MIGLNDDIRFIDILIDLLNGCFDPSSLGQLAPIYQELIFIVLAETLYVKYIDIWNLRVNGTCSGLLQRVLVEEVTIIGDRDKE